MSRGVASNEGQITAALSGNPNAGKTTIFNNLTGGRQHVGNWPGVTVEKKEGTARYGDYEFEVVDLPGTYSLTAYSLEEIIVRDFMTLDKPDLVVDIVDASNIERNLYPVSYTHLRAHETRHDLVCRLLLEKKKKKKNKKENT